MASSIVVARLLTPYEIGIYAISLSITGVLATIQAFGLNALIVREKDLSKVVLATAFSINALITILLSVIIASLSNFAGAFLHEQGVTRVMLVSAIIPISGIFEFLPSASLERDGQFKTMSMINTVRALAVAALTVVLAFCGFSYMSLSYGQLSGVVLSAIAYNIFGRKYVSLAVGFKEWRRITSFGMQMLAIGGVFSITTRLSEFFLGRILGLRMLGFYSRASGINNLIWENIHLVIGRVVFVDLANQRREEHSLRNSYIRIVDINTALLWPAFAGLAIVAGPLIYNVYGAKWVAAAHPLAMLSIAAMVLVSITMTWEIFVVSGETSRQARIEFIRTGGGLLLFVAGCFVSLTVAAASRIGEALFSVFLYRSHLNRMTETRTKDFVPIYLRSALLTAIAVSPAAALMAVYRGSEQTPLLYVVAAIGLGAVGWAAALVVLKHPLAAEAKRLLGRSGVRALSDA